MSQSNRYTSSAQRAERDAFAARGRTIWIGIVVALVLTGIGAWLLFR